MPATHKPLSRQAIVVAGAGSGIGLATARKAAKAGAAVLLVGQDEPALKAAADDIRRAGGRAEVCAADVSDEAEVNRVLDAAAHLLGGFDTWVNDAGVGVSSDLQDLPTDAHRRLFDVNYWAQVYGSKAAVRYWKAHARTGALINIGAVASDVESPLVGAYVASKHAVRGFTNSLRLELLRDKAPVSVTLIKPPGGAGRRAAGEADAVAEAILSAAVHPRREVIVGAAGVLQIMVAYHLPALLERLAAKPAAGSSTSGGARGAAVRRGGALALLRTHPGAATALGLGLAAGALIAGAWARPETRRFVEAELPKAQARARKEARRLRKRSGKFVRDVRRTAPQLQKRAAALARSLPHDLPPELGRRLAREAERTRAALKDVLPRR